MGYMGQPEDIGDAALFLASDAAKYITGVYYLLTVEIRLDFNAALHKGIVNFAK